MTEVDTTEMSKLALPPLVREVTDAYLAKDTEAPGLVEGLYLTGSVALADFHLKSSDIDFVAITSISCDPMGVTALERVHTQLAARYRHPFFDGPYVTWDQLAHDLRHVDPGPHAHEGHVWPRARNERHPVTWYTLARHGIAIRGPRRTEIAIWTNPAALAAWTRGNLQQYWRPWHRRHARLLSKPGLLCLGAWGPAWGVLGISRLHYTLTTGEITSKKGAGQYALDRFPAHWHRIINECLRIRAGVAARSPYGNRLTRRHDALAFMDMAIEDALAIPRALGKETEYEHP